jgi:hypothetical protein
MTAEDLPAATVRFGRLEQRGLLLGLSTAQVTIAGAAVVVAVLAEFTAGAAGLLIASPAWLALLAIGAGRVRGRTVTGWLPVTTWWLARRAARATRFVEKPARRRPTNELRLPGLPAPLTVTTSTGTGAVLLHDRRDGTAVVGLQVRGRDFVLDDPATQDLRVAAWSRVLAALGQRLDVARVQVLHQTAPARALGVRRWWADHAVDLHAPAARVVAGLLADAEDATSELGCWVAVAIRTDRRHGPKAQAVEASLESIVDALRSAEVEVTGWLTRAQLHAHLHGAYDPSSPCIHTQPAAPDGEPLPLPGPMGVAESWSRLRTDSVHHAVYWVAEWPRAHVAPAFLQPLLLAPGAARTFSLLIEPLPTPDAMRSIRRAKVELAADAAQRARIGRIEDETSRAEAADVHRREQDLVAGHGDLRFTGLVTVTAGTAEALAEACRATEAAAARAMCELRLLVGQQAAAHAAAALPFARSVW